MDYKVPMFTFVFKKKLKYRSSLNDHFSQIIIAILYCSVKGLWFAPLHAHVDPIHNYMPCQYPVHMTYIHKLSVDLTTYDICSILEHCSQYIGIVTSQRHFEYSLTACVSSIKNTVRLYLVFASWIFSIALWIAANSSSSP
eukprot:1113076_1